MTMLRAILAAVLAAGALASAALASPAPATAALAATLVARDGLLVLNASGRVRDSRALIGAEMVIAFDGKLIGVRLDALVPASDRPDLTLHIFTIAATGPNGEAIRAPLCGPDRLGRNAAVPVSGSLDEHARHVPNPAKFFLACTSGAVGKCLLWGYYPWGHAPDGTPLEAAYQACTHMVRADYGGDDVHHTKNGTSIDVADIYGIQHFESDGPPAADAKPADAYVFEAGWAADGAVCVAHTRWSEIVTLPVLLAKYPQLGGACDKAAATHRGALLFTRVQAH